MASKVFSRRWVSQASGSNPTLYFDFTDYEKGVRLQRVAFRNDTTILSSVEIGLERVGRQIPLVSWANPTAGQSEGQALDIIVGPQDRLYACFEGDVAGDEIWLTLWGDEVS